MKFFLALSLLFTSLLARPESASMTLESLRSMQQAEAQNEQICRNIRSDPGCIANVHMMESAMGLSVIACRNQVNALHCADVVGNFPGFENKIMQCTPYNVCRTGLTSTALRGCGRYGIQVKNEFLDSFRQLGQCMHNWGCIGNMLVRNATMFAIPGLFAANVARSAVESVREDLQKLHALPCFDPETQAQFACYLTVKYGMAVLGGAGAARTAGAAMVGRMASFERSFVAFRAGKPKVIVGGIAERLGASGEFRMLRMSGNRGIEVSFNRNALRPGRSYTVVFHDGKVVFGDSYVNEEGGLSMTHPIMRNHLGVTRENYVYDGGAVRVNADGSFDVSGRHLAHDSANSANAIALAIRRVIPDARIRTTPGRLSELDQ
jgi:hypothetical protein